MKQQGAEFNPQELEHLKQVSDAQEEIMEKQQRMEKLRDTIANSMTEAFVAIADGSKSAKQAFGDMAKSILKMILEMTIRMIILNTLMPKIGGFLGFKDGGVAGARSGGVFPKGYQPGGISKGPESGYLVELHGVEAIVPLPDGKNIPAQLSGKIQTPAPIVSVQTDTNAITNSFNAALSTLKAESSMAAQPVIVPPVTSNGSGTNNVTVNVSMERGKSSTDREGSEDNNLDQLGRVVAAAVQAELQHQKRPGGILSPYGAS